MNLKSFCKVKDTIIGQSSSLMNSIRILPTEYRVESNIKIYKNKVMKLNTDITKKAPNNPIKTPGTRVRLPGA